MRQIDRKIRLMAVAAVLAAGMSLSTPALCQTIMDEWAGIKAPPPPELKSVTIDPKVTALLVLDAVRQGCNVERRPRCLVSIPKIQALLGQARAKKMTVIHTHYTGTAAGDILKEVAPSAGEAVLGGTTADKFIRTDLENMLKDKGIKTVVIVGAAAEGAVLLTGSAAAMRGIDVIVPVDGVSSSSIYAEQYTAWHMKNAPTVGQRVTLTKTDLVGY